MSPVRLVLLVTACAALAAPLAGQAAQAAPLASAEACSARMSLVERRLVEHAGAGTPALIGYVHLTQPIFQVSVDEAFAMVEAQRARQARCAVASSR